MRVLVCGGRDFDDRERLFAVLDGLDANYGGFDCIISGGARGADTLAAEWAQARHCRSQVFHADWKTDGKAAGPKRNQRMLAEGKPYLVVAFPGGKGTADMVRRAKAAGVSIFESPTPSPHTG